MSTVMGSSACATRGTSVLTMLDFVLILCFNSIPLSQLVHTTRRLQA
jgi:hypothetical protein